MASPFFRPGVTVWLRRWGETLAAGGLGALGLWWFATAGPLLSWAGGAVALIGAAATFAAFQRARFRPRGGGVGVVQLDEGRLTYFGPLSGGSVAVDDIETVALDPRHRPAHWILRDAETELLIPVDAEGAGALFDVFAQLPGLELRTVLTASARPPHAPTTLWRRGGPVPAARRLH